jgi:hypothetical protein
MEKISVAVRVRPLNAAEKVRVRGGKALHPGLPGALALLAPTSSYRRWGLTAQLSVCTVRAARGGGGLRNAPTGRLRHVSGAFQSRIGLCHIVMKPFGKARCRSHLG